MSPLPVSPPMGHLYVGPVVVVGLAAVDESGLAVVVVAGGGGGGGQQASDTKTTREIARIENKEFIFVSVLVT